MVFNTILNKMTYFIKKTAVFKYLCVAKYFFHKEYLYNFHTL